MSDDQEKNYDLKQGAGKTMRAPDLPYRPAKPKSYRPRIGLIGCGGITQHHLKAYQRDGYEIAALCDLREESAQARRKEFAPSAKVFTDYRDLLGQADVDVIDVALHPAPRYAAVEAALQAGKHVLSQKPFVLDLDQGEALVRLEEEKGLRLAVNQNGRWAPYVQYAHQAIRAGLLGEVQTVAITINWDHSWTKGTEFEKIHHLVLYDFAIHWFDMAALFFDGQEAGRVAAATASANAQEVKPPLLAHASVTFPKGQAVLTFDAACKFGPGESILITGSKGTLSMRGAVCTAHTIELHTAEGVARPQLEGTWFPDGFRGSMGELLCAIEENREPSNSARNNLRSLGICFAALGAADSGEPRQAGSVRSIAK
ncbi:MAG: gfo/Idh/MocA family oxidoreductase [Puniceicoccaceae bacterium]|nr:MAG: gfo/Idh/MocA family oxidoreductase [Puniceicoccaceae bacterium]